MDNYNGQNEFQTNQPMQNQYAPNQPMQNQYAPNQQYVQPNLAYVKPKSNAWKVILGIALGIMFIIGIIVAVLVGVIGSTATDYVEKSRYSQDVSKFDTVKVAISTFIVTPESKYVDETIYTLSELMDNTHDIDNVIEDIIDEVFKTDGDLPYTFNYKSEVFKGITTDDVLVSIKDGIVSIYVPVNKKYQDDYSPYVVGTAFQDKR